MSERTVYLSIKEPIFEKQKKKARETAIAADEAYKKDGSLLWENLTLENRIGEDYEIDEDDNVLRVWGDLGDRLGYLSIDIPLDLDIVMDIIQLYVKRVNKIKTILEAAK